MPLDNSTLELVDPKEQVRLLARVVDVSLRLNSTLDLRRLLQYIIAEAAEMLESEAASLLLFDDVKRELRFAAATGSKPDELARIPRAIAFQKSGADVE